MNISPKAAKIIGGIAIVLGLGMFAMVESMLSPLIVLIGGILFLAVGFLQQG